MSKTLTSRLKIGRPAPTTIKERKALSVDDQTPEKLRQGEMIPASEGTLKKMTDASTCRASLRKEELRALFALVFLDDRVSGMLVPFDSGMLCQTQQFLHPFWIASCLERAYCKGIAEHRGTDAFSGESCPTGQPHKEECDRTRVP